MTLIYKFIHIFIMSYQSFFCIFWTTNNPTLNIPEEIEFNGKSIKRTTSIKYLGLNLDEFLNWNSHITSLCRSLKSFFPVFYNIRRYLNNEHIKVIYYTMIYSRIKYGICVYGLTKNENIHKIQVMQNKLLKVLTEKKHRYPTSRLHNDLDILKVEDLVKQDITALICKYLNNNLPAIFHKYFKTFKDIHNYNTRYCTNRLQIPIHYTIIGSMTVKIRGPIIWNSLNHRMRSIKNPKTFKIEYKRSILPYESNWKHQYIQA